MAEALEAEIVVNIRKLAQGLAAAEARFTKAAQKIDGTTSRINQKASQEISNSASNLSRIGNISREQRTNIQNLGYQFGDLAVQIGAGTSVLQAMGQQLPQILGPLGVFGALAGVAAAVIFPLVNAMGLFGDEAVDVAKTLKEVNTAISDLRSITAQYADGDLTKLREKYAEVTDQLWAMVDAQRTLAGIDARKSLDTAISGITDVSAPGMMDSLRGYAASEAGQLRFLRDELSLTDEQARQLFDALNALGTASGPQEQLAAFEQLRSLAAEMLLSQENLSAEQLTLLKNIVAGEDATRQLVAATAEIAPGITTAADEASRLAQNLLDAMSARNRMDAIENKGGGRGDINQWNYREGAPAMTMDDVARLEREQEAAIRKAEQESRKNASKGASAAQKEYNASLREAQSIYDSTRTSAEAYAIELARINGLQEDGFLDADTANRARQQLEDLQPVAQQTASALRSAFDGVFDDPANALRNLAEQLAQMVVYMQLARALPGVFGGSGILPLVANANGGVYSGAGISSYSGSVVSKPTVFPFAKGVGLMGEAGPEAILPLTRIGGKLGVKAAGGGGPGVQIIDQRGAGAPPMETESTRDSSGREMTRIIVRENNKGVSMGMADRAMQSRFGTRTQTVKR